MINTPPKIENIVSAVCDFYKISKEKISEKTKKRNKDKISLAKQIIIFLCYKYNYSNSGEILSLYKALISLLGFSDHTGIYKNHKIIKEIVYSGNTDDPYRQVLLSDIDEIEKIILPNATLTSL